MVVRWRRQTQSSDGGQIWSLDGGDRQSSDGGQTWSLDGGDRHSHQMVDRHGR